MLKTFHSSSLPDVLMPSLRNLVARKDSSGSSSTDSLGSVDLLPQRSASMGDVQEELERERRKLSLVDHKLSVLFPGDILSDDEDDFVEVSANYAVQEEERERTERNVFNQLAQIAGGFEYLLNRVERRYLRWNLLWNFLFCVLLIPIPLWIYHVGGCSSFFWFTNIVSIWSLVVLSFVMIKSISTTMKLDYNVNSDTSWIEKYPKTEKAEKLRHVVMICGYKEPLDLIIKTIDSLKCQTQRERLIVVLGLEEKTPDVKQKQETLEKKYCNVFSLFMVTIHPKGFFPGEIPGKCSNANYAMRKVVNELVERDEFDYEALTVTTCDTDSLFHAKYFEFLGYEFLTRPDANQVTWQAPLFYHFNLDERWSFVRTTGVLREMFMMGLLIPQSINTMSIFSFSMSLCVRKNFFHYRYQMDDIISTLRMMMATKKRVPIRLIPLPVISGPTSGDTLSEEVYEWWRQARRWTIGAGEVFHYFFKKLIFTNAFELGAGISYGFVYTHYYGFVLCGMNLLSVTSFIGGQLQECPSQVWPDVVTSNGLSLFYFSVTLAIFLVFQLIDRWIVIRVLRIKEKNVVWSVFIDWLLCWPTLLLYNIVEYIALWELAFRGKNVCGHDPSKKDSIVKKQCEISPV